MDGSGADDIKEHFTCAIRDLFPLLAEKVFKPTHWHLLQNILPTSSTRKPLIIQSSGPLLLAGWQRFLAFLLRCFFLLFLRLRTRSPSFWSVKTLIHRLSVKHTTQKMIAHRHGEQFLSKHLLASLLLRARLTDRRPAGATPQKSDGDSFSMYWTHSYI